MKSHRPGRKLLGISYYGHPEIFEALIPKDKAGNPKGVPYKTYIFFRDAITKATIDENPVRRNGVGLRVPMLLKPFDK